MPKALHSMSALAIDGHGFLVVGGDPCCKENVYLLCGDLKGEAYQSWQWKILPAMNQPQWKPGMVYFKGNV